jgi:Carboxypeptidase regulatory-like domain
MAGRTFTPADTTVTVASGNVTGQDFVGEGPFTVAGTVTDSSTSLPLASVKLTLSGNMGTYVASTNTLGQYLVKGVPNGSYTLVASRAAYGFSAAQSVNIDSGNSTNKNFTGFKVYSVAGKVLNGTIAVPGITITVSDGTTTRTATTTSTGVYTVTGVPAGTFTVTPSGGSGAFTPSSRSVTITTMNATAVNFTSP